MKIEIRNPGNNQLQQSNLAISPAPPRITHVFSLNHSISAIGYSKHRLLAAGRSGLQIVDLDKKQTQLIFKNNSANIVYMATEEAMVYTINSDNTLTVTDISNPLSPVLLDSFKVNDNIDQLKIYNKKILLVYKNGEIELLQLNSKARLIRVAKTRFDIKITAAALDRHSIVVGDNSGHISVFGHHLKPQAHYQLSDKIYSIVLSHSKAYIANGIIGLTVLDINNPRNIVWQSSLNGIGSIKKISKHNNNILLVGDSNQIYLVDTVGKNPKIVSRFVFPRRIEQLHLQHNIAYIASNKTLMRLDFKNAEQHYLSFDVNFGGSRKVAIRENKAFVADWFSGLHIYDISVPRRPRLLSSLPTGGSPKGIVLSGQYAYLADDDNGLVVIDIKDAKNPKMVTTVDTPGLAYAIAIKNNLLFLADHTAGFHIFDIHNAKQIQRISSVDTAGKVWAIQVQDNLLYLADDYNGLLVYDISQANRPVLFASYRENFAVEDVVIRGKHAFIALFNGGVSILDISKANNIKLISKIDTPGASRSVNVNQSTLWVSDWQAGVQIYDIENINKPKRIGGYDTPGFVWGLAINNKHAYVMDWWSGFSVLDISNATRPTQLGRYHGQGIAQDVRISQGFAYVAYGKGGLQVFDVRTPANPIWVTGMDTKGEAVSLTIAQNKLYLASNGVGIEAFDITNPLKLRRQKTFTWKGKIQKIAIQNSFVFAHTTENKLIGIDMTLDKPKSTFQLPSYNFWLVGERLLVRINKNQYRFYNFKLDSYRTLIPSFKLQYDVIDAIFHKQHLYLSTASGKIVDSILTNKSIKQIKTYDFGISLSDFRQLNDSRFYARSSDKQLVEIDIDENQVAITALYPIVDNFKGFDLNKGTAYLAANNNIISVSMLPRFTQVANTNAAKTILIPNDIPRGGYIFTLINAISGDTITSNKILTVGHTRQPSKRKFTLDDLQKAMRERKLIDSKSNSH